MNAEGTRVLPGPSLESDSDVGVRRGLRPPGRLGRRAQAGTSLHGALRLIALAILTFFCKPMSACARPQGGMDGRTGPITAALIPPAEPSPIRTIHRDPDRHRWREIRSCLQSPYPPGNSYRAATLVMRGRRMLQRAAAGGGLRDYASADEAFAEASLRAPCQADDYADRALAQKGEFRLTGNGVYALSAAMSLHWYLDADPGAADAHQVAREMAALRAKAGVASDADMQWVPLVWAASFDDEAAVRELLSRGVDVNALDLFLRAGMTALGIAAARGELSIVRLLVSHGARLEKGSGRSTPLALAASAGKLDVVRYLVAHGADVNARDSRGYTPLMNAVFDAPYPQGAAIVKYLVAAGARTEIAGKNGMTALDLAAAYGSFQAVRYLLKGHAKVNAVNKDGDVALHFAAMWNPADMAAHLRSVSVRGAKIRCTGPPPLDAVAFQRTQLSFEYPFYGYPLPGLDPAVRDLHCHCRAIYTAMCAKLKIVRYLLAHGAIVNEADRRGMTPLYLAAESGQITAAKILVTHGARINIRAQSEGGNTPLGVAARGGHASIVRYLVSAGADINARNCLGETPMDLARAGTTPASDPTDERSAGRRAVVRFLQARGARSGERVRAGHPAPRGCRALPHGTPGTSATIGRQGPDS